MVTPFASSRTLSAYCAVKSMLTSLFVTTRGTIVKLNSAYYNGIEWIYDISTQDNSSQEQVPESALINIVTPVGFEPTVIPPTEYTPTPPTPAGTCLLRTAR